MTAPVRLTGFTGSTRKDSHNRRLVEIAAGAARAAGAQVQIVSLNDYDLPFYNADDEAAHGLPEGAQKLKDLFLASDGFLIASPEYNGSFSGFLKNALDWASRPGPGETATTLRAFRGKTAGIMSASPGPWGGIRGLAHLRQVLSGMVVLVAAEQLAVPNADTAFDEEGRLKNAVYHGLVEAIGRRTALLAHAMKDG